MSDNPENANSYLKTLLRNASNALNELGYATIDGDKAIIDKEDWEDAMAMRDEIDYYFTTTEKYL